MKTKPPKEKKQGATKAIAVQGSLFEAPATTHDPLQAYLRQLRKTPLMDAEEEYRYARKLVEDGDIDAAKALVSANLRLVVRIAMEYQNVYTNVMDLIQEGNVGLMKAVSKFDPAKNVRLGYYAAWWIRSYILKYLLDNFRLVKLGTGQTQKKLFFQLMREKSRLEAQGILAGPKLLAQNLDVKPEDVEEMQLRLSSQGAEVSIDAPSNGEEYSEPGAPRLLDVLADAQAPADSKLSEAEHRSILKSGLKKFRKTLDLKETLILKERLLSETPSTLQDLGNKLGVTKERARQIESILIQKLREYFKSDLGLGD